MIYTGEILRKRDARQAAALSERIFANAGDAIRKCDGLQAAAAIKQIIADAGDVLWNLYALQVDTVFEHTRANTGDGIRNRDARQGAAFKRIITYTGDVRGKRDGLQAAAAAERTSADSGDALRDLDSRHASAIDEHPITYTGDAIFNYDRFNIIIHKWIGRLLIIFHLPRSAYGQCPILVKRPGNILSACPAIHCTFGSFSDSLLFLR